MKYWYRHKLFFFKLHYIENKKNRRGDSNGRPIEKHIQTAGMIISLDWVSSNAAGVIYIVVYAAEGYNSKITGRHWRIWTSETAK